MNAAEFERAYAERSRVTVEQLRALGYYPAPCACGDEICEGWKMTTAERESGARVDVAWPHDDPRHACFDGCPGERTR